MNWLLSIRFWLIEKLGGVPNFEHEELVTKINSVESEFNRFREKAEGADIEFFVQYKELLDICAKEWVRQTDNGLVVLPTAPKQFHNRKNNWYKRIVHAAQAKVQLQTTGIPYMKSTVRGKT